MEWIAITYRLNTFFFFLTNIANGAVDLSTSIEEKSKLILLHHRDRVAST